MRLAIAAAVLVGCSNPSPAPTAGAGSGSAAKVAGERDDWFALMGHVIVLKAQARLAEHADIETSARTLAGVTSAEPFAFTDLQASTPASGTQVPIMGMSLEPHGPTATQIARMLVVGKLDTLAGTPRSIAIGDGVAKTLGVKVGDEIRIVRPQDPMLEPKPPQVVVVGAIFHTRLDEYNTRLVLLDAAFLADAFDTPTLGVRVRVADPARAPAIARELDHVIGGPPYEVQDWKQLNPGFE